MYTAGRSLRIAQLAPLYESVPPKLYGGTERIVAYLSEALIARGHQVTLFASGDSTCRASLRASYPTALRLEGLSEMGAAYQLMAMSDVYERAAEFDVIHTHLDFWSFPFARMSATPSIATLHGRIDGRELFPLYRYYDDAAVVSISESQREPMPDLNWVGTVHHGLPRELMRYNPAPGKYLAFLGRISPEKRPDLAIEVATRAGLPLKIAAKIDEANRDYYESVIKPMLTRPGIEFIGEIDDVHKSDFLGDAIALLFPIDWPEPFGLVMLEAMACGTPVITRPCGSVPEVIRDGVTGFVRSGIDELIEGAQKAAGLSRAACRQEFEARFTADTMAANYEVLYRKLLVEGTRTAAVARRARGAVSSRATFGVSSGAVSGLSPGKAGVSAVATAVKA